MNKKIKIIGIAAVAGLVLVGGIWNWYSQKKLGEINLTENLSATSSQTPLATSLPETPSQSPSESQEPKATSGPNELSGVKISTDKAAYQKNLKTGYSCDYGDNCISGENVKITIENNSGKEIFIDKSLMIPFTTVYIECRLGGWTLCPSLNSTVLHSKNYTSEDWLENATKIKPNEKFSFNYLIEYASDWDPYPAVKYRVKLLYIDKLEGKDDWKMKDELQEKAIQDEKFKTIYSNEFEIK